MARPSLGSSGPLRDSACSPVGPRQGCAHCIPSGCLQVCSCTSAVPSQYGHRSHLSNTANSWICGHKQDPSLLPQKLGTYWPFLTPLLLPVTDTLSLFNSLFLRPSGAGFSQQGQWPRRHPENKCLSPLIVYTPNI